MKKPLRLLTFDIEAKNNTMFLIVENNTKYLNSFLVWTKVFRRHYITALFTKNLLAHLALLFFPPHHQFHLAIPK